MPIKRKAIAFLGQAELSVLRSNEHVSYCVFIKGDTVGQSNDPLTIYLQLSNKFNGCLPCNPSRASSQSSICSQVHGNLQQGEAGQCGAGREGAGTHPMNTILVHLGDGFVSVDAQSHPPCRQVGCPLVRLEHRCWWTSQGERREGRGEETGSELLSQPGQGAAEGAWHRSERGSLLSPWGQVTRRVGLNCEPKPFRDRGWVQLTKGCYQLAPCQAQSRNPAGWVHSPSLTETRDGR